MPSQCCCKWGAAISRKKGSGEWPEFPCADCPQHAEDGSNTRCRRHAREAGP